MKTQKTYGFPSSNPIELDLTSPARGQTFVESFDDGFLSPDERGQTSKRQPNMGRRKECTSRFQTGQNRREPEKYCDVEDEGESHFEEAPYKSNQNLTKPSPAPVMPSRVTQRKPMKESSLHTASNKALRGGEPLQNKVKFLESELQKSEGNVQELLRYIEKIKKQREVLRDEMNRLQVGQVRMMDENTVLRQENERLRQDLAKSAVKKATIALVDNSQMRSHGLTTTNNNISLAENEDSFRGLRNSTDIGSSILGMNVNAINGGTAQRMCPPAYMRLDPKTNQLVRVEGGADQMGMMQQAQRLPPQMEQKRVATQQNQQLNTSNQSSQSNFQLSSQRTAFQGTENLGSPSAKKPAILSNNFAGHPYTRTVFLNPSNGGISNGSPSPGTPQSFNSKNSSLLSNIQIQYARLPPK